MQIGVDIEVCTSIVELNGLVMKLYIVLNGKKLLYLKI